MQFCLGLPIHTFSGAEIYSSQKKTMALTTKITSAGARHINCPNNFLGFDSLSLFSSFFWLIVCRWLVCLYSTTVPTASDMRRLDVDISFVVVLVGAPGGEPPCRPPRDGQPPTVLLLRQALPRRRVQPWQADDLRHGPHNL
jgi:hypothetical protein